MRKSLQPKWQIFLTLVLILYMVGWNYSNAAATGATYYVDNTNPSCDDTGSGTTTALPFCTIGKGANIAVAGDTVRVLAGSYAETISVPKSGSLGLPITYSAASGVTMSGNGSATGSAFRMSGKSYIVVDGFTITGTVDYGIYVFGSNNITLSNNHVSYSGSPVSGSNRMGIYINSTTNSTISGNTSDHNSYHGILLTNGSHNNMVSNNVAFANAEQWQRDATGIRLDASNNNTLLHNITYGNEDSGLNSYTGSSGNYVIGNLTYGNGDHGIDFNAAPNNTVIGNTVQGNVTVGINFEGASAPGSGGATVANNIMVDNGLRLQIGGGTVSAQAGNLRFDANSLSNDSLDYNLYYLNSGTVQIIWGSTSYTTLAAFQGAVAGQEIHGLQADPFFIAPAPVAQRPAAAPFNVAVNVGDYHLTSGSPAIDSAYADAPSEPLFDLDGNARIDDPATTNTGAGVRAYDDRGVYEFQPTSTPTNQTICLPPVQDSYLIQDAASQNHGSDTDLRVKPDAGKERHIVIGFDLTSIPQSSSVVSSMLRLYETNTRSSQTISVYRLTNSWVESQVTWNNRSTGTPWTTAGGDYQNTQLATFAPNISGQYRDIDVTGVTQGWVNGSFSNYGLMLRSTGANGEVSFRSKEVSNTSQRPQLCITYQQLPTATPIATATATFAATSTPTNQPICLPPVQDSYLIQDAPTQNHGGETDLKIKADAGKERRILIGFDLSSIPQSSTVVSSTLRLYEDTKKDGQTITLYRLSNSWVELQTTWNNRSAGTAWSTAGGDFNATQVASFLPNLDTQYREIDVTGVTQGWVNGSFANYGLLLRSTGVNGEVRFKSREAAANQNPQLCITYQQLPTATPIATATATFAATSTPTYTPTATATDTPTGTPLPPTPTPTAAITDTPTAAVTDTPTSTPTPTFTPTTTFTPTPTGVSSSSLTFIANADSYVNQTSVNSNYGTNVQLWMDGDTGASYETYLKFSVTGITGTIQSATLRVYSTSSTVDGPTVYATTNDWTETGITWNMRPARTSSELDDKAAIATGVWVEYNVTTVITGDGTYSFALVPTSTDAVSFSAREGSQPPQLVLTIAP